MATAVLVIHDLLPGNFLGIVLRDQRTQFEIPYIGLVAETRWNHTWKSKHRDEDGRFELDIRYFAHRPGNSFVALGPAKRYTNSVMASYALFRHSMVAYGQGFALDAEEPLELIWGNENFLPGRIIPKQICPVIPYDVGIKMITCW